MGLILLIVLIVLLMGGLPRWWYSRNWGYGPSGGLGLLVVLLLILVLAGYVPRRLLNDREITSLIKKTISEDTTS